jgi:hypothetical protein
LIGIEHSGTVVHGVGDAIFVLVVIIIVVVIIIIVSALALYDGTVLLELDRTRRHIHAASEGKRAEGENRREEHACDGHRLASHDGLP